MVLDSTMMKSKHWFQHAPVQFTAHQSGHTFQGREKKKKSLIKGGSTVKPCKHLGDGTMQGKLNTGGSTWWGSVVTAADYHNDMSSSSTAVLNA